MEKLKEMGGGGGVGCYRGGVRVEKMVVLVFNLKRKKKRVEMVVLCRKKMEVVFVGFGDGGEGGRWLELGGLPHR